jgi:hypothetical protein
VVSERNKEGDKKEKGGRWGLWFLERGGASDLSQVEEINREMRRR